VNRGCSGRVNSGDRLIKVLHWWMYDRGGHYQGFKGEKNDRHLEGENVTVGRKKIKLNGRIGETPLIEGRFERNWECGRGGRLMAGTLP